MHVCMYIRSIFKCLLLPINLNTLLTSNFENTSNFIFALSMIEILSIRTYRISTSINISRRNLYTYVFNIRHLKVINSCENKEEEKKREKDEE